MEKQEQKQKQKVITVDQLLALPKTYIPWVVRDLLPSSGVSILVSEPKKGKSTLLKYLLSCVAQGKPFLGFETFKGRCLYLDMEDTVERVQDQFSALKMPPGVAIDVWVAGRINAGIAQLLDLMMSKKNSGEPYNLVAVDGMTDLRPVNDINSYTETKAALKDVESIARTTGAHLICSHHANRGYGSGSKRVLGSTAIFGTVDSLISLEGKNENNLTVSATLRHSPPVPKTRLIREGFSFRLGDVIGFGIDKSQDRVENVLLQLGKPCDTATIMNHAKMAKRVVLTHLTDLVESGRVIRSGSGKSGDPFLYASNPSDQELFDNSDNLLMLSKK